MMRRAWTVLAGVLALLVVAGPGPAVAQDDGEELSWLDSYEDALEIAAEEERPVLIEFGAPG